MTVKRFCKNLIYSKNSVFKTGFRKSLRVLLFSLKTVLIRIDFIDTLSFEVFQTSFGRLTQLKEQRIFNLLVKDSNSLPPTISGAVVQLVQNACLSRKRSWVRVPSVPPHGNSQATLKGSQEPFSIAHIFKTFFSFSSPTLRGSFDPHF